MTVTDAPKPYPSMYVATPALVSQPPPHRPLGRPAHRFCMKRGPNTIRLCAQAPQRPTANHRDAARRAARDLLAEIGRRKAEADTMDIMGVVSVWHPCLPTLVALELHAHNYLEADRALSADAHPALPLQAAQSASLCMVHTLAHMAGEEARQQAGGRPSRTQHFEDVFAARAAELAERLYRQRHQASLSGAAHIVRYLRHHPRCQLGEDSPLISWLWQAECLLTLSTHHDAGHAEARGERLLDHLRLCPLHLAPRPLPQLLGAYIDLLMETQAAKPDP